MSVDKYENPHNTPEIMERLRSTPTLGGVKALVDEVFPTWFVTTMNSFCEDYPHFQKNWKTICDMANVRPAQVMIVDDFKFSETHSLVCDFAACFTKAGFVVRRKSEFIPCEGCGCAVPTQTMWRIFNDKNNDPSNSETFVIPAVWSATCSGC